MRGSRVLTIEDFSKGLSLTSNKWNTPFDMAYDLADVEPLGHFGLRKRQATTSFSTGYSAALDLLVASRSLSLLFVGEPSLTAGKIWTAPLAGGSPTQVGANLTNFGAPLFAIEAPTIGGQGPIFWAAQTGAADTDASAYYYSTGAARGTWTGPPAGRVRALAYHGNRVWVAIGTRLYFSQLGDPTNFPAANVVDFEPWASGTLAGAGSITALIPCGAVLLVFKAGKSWVVYDLDTGANRTLGDIGCVGARACVQDSEGSVYFASEKGVYHTDSSTVREVNNALGYGLNSASYAVPSTARMAAVSRRYIILTSPTQTYVFDSELQSWWYHQIGLASNGLSGGGALHMIANPNPAVSPGVIYIPAGTSLGDRISAWRPDHSGADNAAAASDSEGSRAPRLNWSGGLIELEKEVTTLKRLREASIVGGGSDTITVLGRSTSFGSAWAGATIRKRLASFGVAREWNFTLAGSAGTDPNQRVLSVTMAFIPRKN